MDWARAKTILIGMFLILNIFLLYNIYQKESETTNITQNEISEISSILKTNNIVLDAQMPTKIKTKSFLKVEDVSYDEQVLVSSFFGNEQNLEKEKANTSSILYKKDGKTLEIYSNKKIIFRDNQPLGNIKGMDKNQILNYVKDYLKLKGLYQKNSLVDKFEPVDGGYTITYKQEYKGYRIFGSYLKIKLIESGINELEMLWFNPVQFADAPKPIKTPLEILLIFAKDIKNVGIETIKNIELGYYLPQEDTKNAAIYAIPVWKVQTTSEVFYYNAYEGYLETRNKI